MCSVYMFAMVYIRVCITITEKGLGWLGVAELIEEEEELQEEVCIQCNIYIYIYIYIYV